VGPHPRRPRSGFGNPLRFLLPSPTSARHGLCVLVAGFGVEGATEAYQFLERGNLGHGPVEYYVTLATTILGFYLMFLGLREWHAYHPKLLPRSGEVWSRRRLGFGVALWIGGTLSTAALGLALGGQGASPTPVWVAWPVGGFIVLAFGSFFYGLRAEAHRVGSPSADVSGWVAFAWSLGVAAIAGLVVGDRTVPLLTEFVTNWVALVASVAPIIVAMSPLCVTYALMIGAFSFALRDRGNGTRERRPEVG
jgi:hypothetical protein